MQGKKAWGDIYMTVVEMRACRPEDAAQMAEIWNEVVRAGEAFPQTEELEIPEARALFAAQSYAGVAARGSEVLGLYILHPNNVGRCGHIANASFAVKSGLRGMGIGELLVRDCLAQARALGFRIMQFNAVVAINARAIRLYERLGFHRVGTIPGGFLLKDGRYEDILVYYINL